MEAEIINSEVTYKQYTFVLGVYERTGLYGRNLRRRDLQIREYNRKRDSSDEICKLGLNSRVGFH